MPDPVPTLATYKAGENASRAFSVCIYGKGGSGKTTLIGTMPGRGLVVDVPQIEGGTFVLSQHADRIDITNVEAWKDIEAVERFLRHGEHAYKWVAIDSITAMIELAKRRTLKERNLNEDPHTMHLQDWGKMGRLVGEMIYRFRTLPLHTIWIAQERKFGSDEDLEEERMIGPDVSPAVLSDLKPPLLMMARLTASKASDGTWERRLLLGPDARRHCKFRTVAPELDVPRIVRNPNLGGILGYLLGKNPNRPEQVDETPTTLSVNGLPPVELPPLPILS